MFSAAQVAMLILRNGGSAIDAVEMAVKILEDREITNAGYGSNLAMDGVAECDASIVDHHGRSGAVGAVAREYFSHYHPKPLTNSPQRSRIRSLWLGWS
jgi:isoaspartyl peptidase/L-asparaginase-like protein (Ntn-hydrolase superfamily)